jgi:hypothetical protein
METFLAAGMEANGHRGDWGETHHCTSPFRGVHVCLSLSPKRSGFRGDVFQPSCGPYDVRVSVQKQPQARL